MATDSSDSDQVGDLVDEYVSRQHAGESPSITEYCQQYPDLADEIRELFPLVSMMQSAKSDSMGLESTDSMLPDQIGDYLIVQEIGRGGMGVVYEAQQKQLGRPVALKVLARRLAGNKRALARFHREARAVAKLHHTNIVPLFEVGEDGGQSFLTMQLIRGTSLDRVIVQFQSGTSKSRGSRTGSNTDTPNRDSKLIKEQLPASTDSQSSVGRGSLHDSSQGVINLLKSSSSGSESRSSIGGGKRYRAVVRAALQVAEALKYAHGRGIIHRDVKPSNILLDESGVVWLTDFGLAKSDEDEHTDDLTQTGDFLGTMRYMSPERFRGECDERADIYALGLTLYEMLTGKEVFESSDRLKLMRMIDQSDPTSPRILDPRIPRDLETIVLKSINKDPASRYKSAGAMAEDLERFLQDRPIKARRHTMAERLVRWSRRNRSLSAALAGIATLLVLMVIGLTIANFRESDLRETALKRGDQLEQNLYFSHMNLAGQAAGDVHGVYTIKGRLEQWKPDVIGRDLRGWEWYYLYAVSHRASFTSKPLDAWCWYLKYSPDGNEFVNTVNGWGIQIRNSETGEVVRELETGSARYVDWSPNGKKIAIAKFGNGQRISVDSPEWFSASVEVYDAQSLDEICRFECPEHTELETVKWSQDSKQLAVCGDNLNKELVGRVVIHDGRTGNLLTELKGHTSNVRSLSWHPGAHSIATMQVDNIIRIWDPKSGEQTDEFKTTTGGWTQIAWSPDGEKIACSGTPFSTFDLGSRKETLSESNAISVAWHPDGSQVAVAETDGTVKLLDAKTLNIRSLLYGHSGGIWGLDWRSDGSQLVSAELYSGIIRTWDIDPSDQSQQFYSGSSWFAWGKNGASIAGADVMLDLNSNNLLPIDEPLRNPVDVSLAIAGDAGIARLGDSDGSEPLSKKVGGIRAMGWSHDNRLATIDASGQLNVWDASGNQLFGPKSVHQGDRHNLRWSSDGTRIATVGTDNMIRIWDSQSWDQIWETTKEDYRVVDVCWSPDGKRVATSHRNALFVWDAETGEELAKLDDLQEEFVSIDWSPDGTRLAVGGSSLSVWDVTARRVAMRLRTGSTVPHVRWGPRGVRLAFSILKLNERGHSQIQILCANRGYQADENRD